MATKPRNLIYGVDERPPVLTTLFLGLQHTFVMSTSLVIPVVIVSEIGGTQEQIRTVVTYSMIAAGIATILQSFKRGPVGSGYLCPQLCGPSFLSASIQAAWLGGLPLLFGMTTIAGVFEAALSRLVYRLRGLFPPTVTGLVVLMVGVALVPIAASSFLGVRTADAGIELADLTVGAVTLAVMVSLNIWGRGALKLFGVLLGIVIGYVAAYVSGVLTQPDLLFIWASPMLDIPERPAFNWSFSWSLLIPFLLASLASSVKTIGDVLTCQKINDADWKEPDMKSISGGLLADGCSSILSGVFGGMGISTSSSNVGVSIATGATSRRIAWATGGIFILLGFLPKLAGVYSVMPKPVMGAALVFVASFMVVAGIQILLTSHIGTRETLVIGLPLIFGLSVDILPDLYSDIHPWLEPFFSSSLALATVLAIALNQVFNIGRRNAEV